MLSLYIHIPFCNHRCQYCSFSIYPVENTENIDSIVETYITNLEKEIVLYADFFGSEEIKTIYFGGGTPNKIGAKNIIRIIDFIKQNFNTENLVELSIELNPYPEEEIFDLIKTINKKYRDFPRIRFSFGIQSLDNKVLKESGRENTFLGIVDFLRGLRNIKMENNIYNFDFIAFGKWNTNKNGEEELRNDHTVDFFENFVESGFAESFSLYTLELFPGSLRYHKDREKHTNHQQITEEFNFLKDIIVDGGYIRYEISNFSKLGQNSIHNRVYRNMENFIGLGSSASSYINANINNFDKFITHLNLTSNEKIQDSKGIRWTNKPSMLEYNKGETINHKSIEILTHKDYLIEKFFLTLRTNDGITNIDEFQEILVDKYLELIKLYQKENLCILEDKKLTLTDGGMNVFNSIVTDLLKEI